jgi:hypothetical protein
MASADLLKALKDELAFLEQQGYGQPFRSKWRPTLLFRDSPICLNFNSSAPIRPCSACRLFQFVPEESRSAFIPCHRIPLNKNDETIARLYRAGTQHQLDTAYRQWLLKTIQELEERKEASHEDA